MKTRVLVPELMDDPQLDREDHFSRFDLNGVGGRFLGGCALSLLDSLLDFFLRRLMDQRIADLQWWETGLRALATGVLVLVASSFVERSQDRRRARRLT